MLGLLVGSTPIPPNSEKKERINNITSKLYLLKLDRKGEKYDSI